MNTFIENCMRQILNDYSNVEEYRIVIPSKRARRYFFESFVRLQNNAVILPEIVTIDELIQGAVPLPKIDKTRQLFLLFECTRKQPGFEELSFESFLAWGPLVLNDFDEMQRYLLDADQVFKNLISIKELESWNLEEGKEYSESQQQFMAFWKILPDIHAAFIEALALKEVTTSALALRNLSSQDSVYFADKFIYFIGFNALTLAEQKAIKTVLNAKKGAFWMDADRYYFENTSHEAGLFIRNNCERFSLSTPQFMLNNLETNEINIELIACPQLSGQVKVAATELAKLTTDELDSSLVLLADERLIIPMIKNIPSSVGHANVTLGLPLGQTALKSFVDLLFSVQENKERFKTQSIYFKDLMGFFQHSFITVWLASNTKEKVIKWELDTIKNNRIFQQPNRLNFGDPLDELIGLLFTDWEKNYLKAIETIQKINAFFKTVLTKSNELERQIIHVFEQAVVSLYNLALEGLPEMNVRTFKMFFHQHWSSHNLAYHGNPTKGIQIMGLLETRLLDFERVIILGMNEGILPNNNHVDSIIPMDLRRSLGLPTTREKQALYAHHFYRLLHRAKKVIVTYALGGEGIGVAELSRYISQIEMELSKKNTNVVISKKMYTTPLKFNSGYSASKIEKSAQIIHVLDNYFAKNISSSALNKYLSCPLDFYYRYLAELGEAESIEEDLESSSMGKIIHNTLDVLYSPFVERDSLNQTVSPPPKPLSLDDLELILAKAPAELKQQFVAYLDNDESLIASGKNYLTFTVALQLIKNLIQNDMAFLKNTNTKDFYIHRLEASISHQMEVEINGTVQTINWIGFIDRIDRIGEQYRLIDYKSGKVKKEHVSYTRKEDVKSSFTSCKHALQLAVYFYLFEKNYGFRPAEMGIYAIQKQREAWFPLDLNGLDATEFIKDFEVLVHETIHEIYDLQVPFTHNVSAKYCNYC
ncbi:MAG: PD-(D/E)XK nuclease family protein [Flavobacteriia bacterium]|nr:PD-(D/E)XK nuclease family protein [Flavobacteriia bacterium]